MSRGSQFESNAGARALLYKKVRVAAHMAGEQNPLSVEEQRKERALRIVAQNQKSQAKKGK